MVLKNGFLKLDKFRNNKILFKKGFYNKDKFFFICWDGLQKNLYICIFFIFVIVMWMWFINGGIFLLGGGVEEFLGEIIFFFFLFL